MSQDPAAFAAFDAAISALATHYAHRATPGAFRKGEEPGTLLPRASWAAQLALDLALESAVLTPVTHGGGPRASPAELPIYGAFAYTLAQGFRHAGWAARQRVDLDAVVGKVLARHGYVLGLDPTLSLAVLGRAQYRGLRRRALERRLLLQAVRATSDGFVAWVLDPSVDHARWLGALYRYFCANRMVVPLLAAEQPAPPASSPAHALGEGGLAAPDEARRAFPGGESPAPRS
jgi:hypothetical protein